MFAKFATALAFGFVGAYPFASASGMIGMIRGTDHVNERMLVVFGGIILFFLALALIGPTLRLVRQVLETLGRVDERPKPMVAVAMMILGATCAIAAIQIQLTASNRPPSGLTMNLGGTGMNLNGGTTVEAQATGSLALGILTLLTFFLGASLIGLGIWASLKPQRSAVALAKPAVPEFAEVATAAVS